MHYSLVDPPNPISRHTLDAMPAVAHCRFSSELAAARRRCSSEPTAARRRCSSEPAVARRRCSPGICFLGSGRYAACVLRPFVVLLLLEKWMVINTNVTAHVNITGAPVTNTVANHAKKTKKIQWTEFKEVAG
ncbi:hypothetical protein Tco_1217125 [Tanacetum coccineum]